MVDYNELLSEINERHQYEIEKLFSEYVKSECFSKSVLPLKSIIYAYNEETYDRLKETDILIKDINVTEDDILIVYELNGETFTDNINGFNSEELSNILYDLINK